METKHTTVRLREDLKQAWRELAAEKGLSMTAWLESNLEKEFGLMEKRRTRKYGG